MCDRSSGKESCFRKGSTVGLMLCHCHFKILKFIFEVRWDNGTYAWAELIHVIFVVTTARHPISTEHSQCHTSTDCWWAHTAWEINRVQSKHEVSMLHLRLRCIRRLSADSWQIWEETLSLWTRICSKCRQLHFKKD